MAIDFEIPAEAKAIRARVRQWVHDECMPAEKKLIAGEDYKTILGALRKKARAQGLWCPFIPKEHGGMGLGPLANALVQMELGESYLGALSMNTQGPDDATMLTLLEHGTEYQKEKFLKPLLNGDKRICYSMTERASGADATGMQTRADKAGNDRYVLNGEKWFSSAASVADIALVMAKTDPNAPRHQQFSTFLVELPNPGYRIKRNIATMALEGPLSHILGGGHAEIEIKDLEVPSDNLLGGEGKGFSMGQHRLAYGRLRHGMHNVAMAQRALDMATARVTDRSTFGKKLDGKRPLQVRQPKQGREQTEPRDHRGDQAEAAGEGPLRFRQPPRQNGDQNQIVAGQHDLKKRQRQKADNDLRRQELLDRHSFPHETDIRAKRSRIRPLGKFSGPPAHAQGSGCATVALFAREATGR